MVSSTAATLRYGTDLQFIDQSEIIRPEETDSLVTILREHGVTYLVISERHTLFEFQNLESLLLDSPSIPLDLEREMLITNPKRLAIFRVKPP